MAARSTGSATISFGLVSIPIKIYTATSSQSVSFNMLHKTCNTRIKQQLFCPLDNVVVDRKDTVKGFEYGKDQFVTFEGEELKRLEAEKTERLEIVEFVPEASVDLIYIEHTNYLGPGKGGDRAYKLLSEAMVRTKRMAVGRFYSHGKQNLVLLRPYKGGMLMHAVYYADEVRSFDDVERPGEVTFKPVEEELADKLIHQLSSTDFKPEQYHDEYRDRVNAAVEAKVAGKEIEAPAEQPEAQIIDLFEALKRSLGEPANQAASSSAATSDEPAAAAGESDEDKKPLKKVVAHKPKKKATG
jgi:DNA end-binding protein Ku